MPDDEKTPDLKRTIELIGKTRVDTNEGAEIAADDGGLSALVQKVAKAEEKDPPRE